MIVKRTIQHQAIVGGAGAIEMEISKRLRNYARGIKDKRQLLVSGLLFGHCHAILLKETFFQISYFNLV